MQQELKLSKNTAKLHQMFGKKLYANPYSFISEICQNAVDSHRMAGEKDPVVVGIKHIKSVHGANGSNMVFYIKDIGLSFADKEDFVNKVCTILESGKSEDKTDSEDCPMGMHGIGSISVSAYQPQWKYTVVTPDGRKFTCTLQEVEGIGLTYDISDYIPTDEYKSVLFEVDVKLHGLVGLVAAMKDKLAYFKDIMFEFDDSIIKAIPELLVLNSTFKLYQSDDFQISTLSRYGELHISMDQYSYMIRWDILGIKPINLNIALKFTMADGLVPDITRENLCHTPDYKTIILDKIKKVADWFVTEYNKLTPVESTDLKHVIDSRKSEYKLHLEGKDYRIGELLPYTKIIPVRTRFKGVSESILKKFLHWTNNGVSLFEIKYYINHNGTKQLKDFEPYSLKNKVAVRKTLTPTVLKYLRENLRNTGVYYPNPVSLHKGPRSCRAILDLAPKSEMRKHYHLTGVNLWRDPIEQWKKLAEASVGMNFIKAEDIKIPSTAVVVKKKAYRKAKISIDDMTGEVGIKYGEKMIKSQPPWNCKFTEKIIQVADLHKQPYLHIYGTEEQRTELDHLWCLCCIPKGTKSKMNRIIPCIISAKQQAHIKRLNLHNFMDIETFFKGKHNSFRKLITGYIIATELERKYPKTLQYKDLIREHISVRFAEDIDALQKFSSKYNAGNYMYHHGSDNPFIKSVLQIAHEGKLYDMSIWETYTKVLSDIDKFDFVEFFAPTITSGVDNTIKTRAIAAMEDVARQRKIRMNWKNYAVFDFKEKIAVK